MSEPVKTIEQNQEEYVSTLRLYREAAARGAALRDQATALQSQLADVRAQYVDWKARAPERQAMLDKMAALNTQISQQLAAAATAAAS